MACLSRYLTLMIGDKIDQNDEYWQLYIKLRRVIGIITAPKFIWTDIYQMKESIEDLLSEFFRLLREIPPKGHNLTHMVEISLLMGPLIHLWAMPMERKHQDSTAVVVSTRSHKNLPYTIGVRNQLYMSYIRENIESVENKLQLGTIISNNADTEFRNLSGKININGPLNCKKYSRIKLNGKLIDPGTVVVLKIKESPEFGKVLCIYEAKKTIFLHVKKLNNIDLFNKYYYAYEVEELSDKLSEKYLINIADLPEVDPCVMHTNKHGTFVATRYDF